MKNKNTLKVYKILKRTNENFKFAIEIRNIFILAKILKLRNYEFIFVIYLRFTQVEYDFS